MIKNVCVVFLMLVLILSGIACVDSKNDSSSPKTADTPKHSPTSTQIPMPIESLPPTQSEPSHLSDSMSAMDLSTSVADIQEQRIRRREIEEEEKLQKVAEPLVKYMTSEQRMGLLEQMYTEMKKAAKELDFERAAELRDEIRRIEVAEKKGKKSK